MRVALLITFFILYTLSPTGISAQVEQKPKANFRVYAASGKEVALEDVVNAMGKSEVVFLGETHNDAVAHQLEAELLQSAASRYGLNAAADSRRQLVLSLEMFERDVQTILDEYLSGLILERMFFKDSRPWSNYQTDYRPLVEFARKNNLPVIAANAPARYANQVSRLGRGSLASLSKTAKAWLAPLPYGEASTAYAEKFNSFMESATAGHDPNSKKYFLDAQVLRDATMAYAIAQNLKSRQKALVLHVTGIFHVAGRMGVPEQLTAYRPQTRMIVVAIVPAVEAPKPDAESLEKFGDFVFITTPAQP